MRQFVPMTDELLYQAGKLPGPLVPYRCGVPCWHRLRAEPEQASGPAAAARAAAGEPGVSASPSADPRA